MALRNPAATERSACDQLLGEATVDFLPHGVVYTVTCALDDGG